MRIKAVVLAVSVVMGLAACKKNKDTSDPGNNPTTPTSDALKDSSLLYARDIYLWYKNIPSTFNAQSYADPDAIMEAIRQYSSEPGFTGPVDRWSFGMK